MKKTQDEITNQYGSGLSSGYASGHWNEIEENFLKNNCGNIELIDLTYLVEDYQNMKDILENSNQSFSNEDFMSCDKLKDRNEMSEEDIESSEEYDSDSDPEWQPEINKKSMKLKLKRMFCVIFVNKNIHFNIY